MVGRRVGVCTLVVGVHGCTHWFGAGAGGVLVADMGEERGLWECNCSGMLIGRPIAILYFLVRKIVPVWIRLCSGSRSADIAKSHDGVLYT